MVPINAKRKSDAQNVLNVICKVSTKRVEVQARVPVKKFRIGIFKRAGDPGNLCGSGFNARTARLDPEEFTYRFKISEDFDA